MRFRSTWLLWAMLSAPALWFLWVAAMQSAPDHEALLRPTGEWSARLLIVALMLTPLLQLFPKLRALRWLVARRRALGVAAFGYGALHALFYVLAMTSVRDMLAELRAIGIWTGWAALALMVPLALTSNDRAQRLLRAGWKRLQRLAYPAALLTLAHWVFVHNDVFTAAAHFAPLALLQLSRILTPVGARAAPIERQSHA